MKQFCEARDPPPAPRVRMCGRWQVPFSACNNRCTTNNSEPEQNATRTPYVYAVAESTPSTKRILTPNSTTRRKFRVRTSARNSSDRLSLITRMPQFERPKQGSAECTGSSECTRVVHVVCMRNGTYRRHAPQGCRDAPQGCRNLRRRRDCDPSAISEGGEPSLSGQRPVAKCRVHA